MTNKLSKILLLILISLLTCLTYSQETKDKTESLTVMEKRIYKTVRHKKLRLYIFQPTQRKENEKLPAIVFFFGGGWYEGHATQFAPQSLYLAERGMVAICADYRVKKRQGVTPFECVADAKSAIRWVRAHAADLNIDENRIAAGGGSSGGHLAACTALIKDFDEKNEDLNISSAANALVLFNPVLDMSPIVKKETWNWSKRGFEISPIHHMFEGAPPTIIFHGTNDDSVPFQQTINFCEEMKKYGNSCEVVPFEGRGHGFFNYDGGKNPDFFSTMDSTVRFLISIGYLRDGQIIK